MDYPGPFWVQFLSARDGSTQRNYQTKKNHQRNHHTAPYEETGARWIVGVELASFTKIPRDKNKIVSLNCHLVCFTPGSVMTRSRLTTQKRLDRMHRWSKTGHSYRYSVGHSKYCHLEWVTLVRFAPLSGVGAHTHASSRFSRWASFPFVKIVRTQS